MVTPLTAAMGLANLGVGLPVEGLMAANGASVVAIATALFGSINAITDPYPIVPTAEHPLLTSAPVRFDPRSLLDNNMPPAWGEKPLDQPIPVKLLPGQKAPPCDSGLREEAINAGFWQQVKGEPPCDRLFRHDNKCYRPIAAEPKKPVGPTP